MSPRTILLAVAVALASPGFAETLVVRGRTVHVVDGPPISDGVVVVRDGKIAAVGRASDVRDVPKDARVLSAEVVTPGLIDAHSVVGLAGYLNQDQDQDQLDGTDPMQPELRAIDSYDARERLLEWVRGFGVTTLHAGHAPGKVVSGQTLVAKTRGDTVDEAVIVPFAMIAATLGEGAVEEGKSSPGTRSKVVAMLRAELLEAREYRKKHRAADAGDEGAASESSRSPAHEEPGPRGRKGDTDLVEEPVAAEDAPRGRGRSTETSDSKEDGDEKTERSLRKEALVAVLERRVPLLVTAQRHQDIETALRLAKEMDIRIVLDGAAESYLLIDQIKEAGVPVIVHPTMWRASGETENLSMETASKLHAAGIPIALQSGFESYVPKTRVVLWEAGLAAARGLGAEAALESITLGAARILGLDDRIGSLEVGKDADLALYDGDPFEYTTHCVATVIDGVVVSDTPR